MAMDGLLFHTRAILTARIAEWPQCKFNNLSVTKKNRKFDEFVTLKLLNLLLKNPRHKNVIEKK